MNNHTINWEDFMKVDMRVGTVLSAELFKELRNPAYKLKIDFGELGIKKSSSQLTDLYQPEDLVGKQVIAVVNFPPKQIKNMMSECLVLGLVGDSKSVTLVHPDRPVKNGMRLV